MIYNNSPFHLPVSVAVDIAYIVEIDMKFVTVLYIVDHFIVCVCVWGGGRVPEKGISTCTSGIDTKLSRITVS